MCASVSAVPYPMSDLRSSRIEKDIRKQMRSFGVFPEHLQERLVFLHQNKSPKLRWNAPRQLMGDFSTSIETSDEHHPQGKKGSV